MTDLPTWPYDAPRWLFSSLSTFMSIDEMTLWVKEPNENLEGKTPMEYIQEGKDEDVKREIRAKFEYNSRSPSS